MPDATRRFEPGTLWRTIVERERFARRRNALQPLATEVHTVADHGVQFQVRVVSSLARRRESNARPPGTEKNGGRANPFLPYEQDLFVADVSETHVCLLNKYNVIDHHLLIVTRAFEHQQSPLTPDDFAALGSCMAEYHALAFYNSGPVAGASQPHKHLQLVPLPLGGGGSEIPIAPVLESAPYRTEPGRVDRLPFVHAFAWLDAACPEKPLSWPSRVFALYRTMLAAVGHDPSSPRQPPYNLLITRRFLLLIPRSREGFETVPVNALGFAGSFFVPDPAGLEIIRRAGPMTVLQRAAIAR